MRNSSQKTKLAILLHYVGEWRQRAGSRETVAQLIVEKHIELGNNTLPKLQFDTTGDVYTLAKNAADRIFRWLDDATKDNNFMPFNFEDSILAAMPDDLRLAYLNDWLGRHTLSVAGVHAGADGSYVQHLKDVSKESAEATGALADLIDGATGRELEKAERELVEQIEATNRALASIRAQRKLKAVA